MILLFLFICHFLRDPTRYSCRLFPNIATIMLLSLIATSFSSSSNSGVNNLLNSHQSSCIYEMAKRQGVEVYFINMDKSTERKANTEMHLGQIGYKYKRVRGLTPSEIYIPDDIEKTWRTAWCKLQVRSQCGKYLVQ